MPTNVNPDKGFQVNGTMYTMRFSIRAMAALQEHYELASLEEVGERLQKSRSISIQDLTAVLWAGLQTHHRGITKDEVLDLIDEMGLPRIQELINSAFGAASVEQSKKVSSRPRKPGPSTG